MSNIISEFRKSNVNIDQEVQSVLENAEASYKNSNPPVIKKINRSLMSELFHSIVWLYAKLITPLLIATILVSAFALYYLLADGGITPTDKYSSFALVTIIGGGLYALFASFDDNSFKGIPVSREDAPLIWAEVDSITKTANSPPVSHLYIDNDFNASASIKHTKGLKQKRELEVTIGLPLMAALSQQECASVIAHEIGHHHGGDARRSLAIYHANERAGIISRLAWPEYHFAQVLLLPVSIIFLAYKGVLILLSQRLRHKCEFEADNFAAAVCGVEATGRTDIAMAVFTEDIIRVLWEPVETAFRTGSEIPKNLFANLPERFKAALKPEEFAEKLNKAMKEETSFFDSHPSTQDRLANIGASIALPKFESENTAARTWLKDQYDFIAAKLQKHWLEDFNAEFGEAFEEQGKRARRAQQTLSELEAYHESNAQTPDSILAQCLMRLDLAKPEEHHAIIKEALDSGFYIPDIEIKCALHDLHAGNINGIERLLKLIENEAKGLCLNAHETLQAWIDNSSEINVKHVELRNTVENIDFVAAIKDLKSAATAADEKHLKSKVTCENVEVPNLPMWQMNAINSWFQLHPEIDRVWLHICTDSDIDGHNFYYLTVTHKNQEECDWCVAFDEFDSIDLPLLGTVIYERIIGETDIEHMLDGGKKFPALHKSVISTPPFYQRNSNLAYQVERDISESNWGTS